MIKYKKNIYLFLGLILLLVIWNQAFWKWKYNWNNIWFSVNSWTRYCPSWEELVDSWKNKRYWTSWTLKCMVMDKLGPTISVNWNSYTNWAWTNKDVKLDISVSDDKLWVKSVTYSINWENKIWSSSFSLSFSEEWTYNISITAEDNSVNESPDWASTSVWNKSNLIYVVKIDKSIPVLNTTPTEINSWWNNKPIINFNIKDTYKWKNIVIKSFSCSWKPSNSYWLSPVESSWALIWTCDADLKDCNIDSNFVPYPNHSTQWCNWQCMDWYTKWNDNQCHANIITENCWALPAWKYKYNTSNILAIESSITSAYWILPTWVANNWDFLAKYDFASWLYSPNVSQCSSECESWYHFDSYEWKCIADTALICCKQNYPLTTSADIAWSSLNGVDCNDPANATNVKCVYNSLCWWYVKDILKYWENSTWKYETEWVKNLWSDSEACWFVPIPNSDWTTCNPRYYLINRWTATQACDIVPVWQWSGQNNQKYNCTNKPNNSYYTSNWDNNNCDWSCNNNYNKNWSSCKAVEREVSCTSKPINTVWNNVDKITQEWDWTERFPSNISTYNTNWSYSECRFECKSWYLWDWDSCYKPACDSWEEYNEVSKKCEKSISYSCDYTASNIFSECKWYVTHNDWDKYYFMSSPNWYFIDTWMSIMEGAYSDDKCVFYPNLYSRNEYSAPTKIYPWSTADIWEDYTNNSIATTYSCPNWWTLSGTNCIKTCTDIIKTSPNCSNPVYSSEIWKCY